MSDTDGNESAAMAWVRGDMQKAQELNQPIADGPAVAPSGDVPAYLENHLAVQNLEQKRTAAPDPAQAETAMVERAATKLTELGAEGQALVQEWGGHTSPNFQENFSYARAAFADIAKNRPDLIAKVEASGLGNDPAVLRILAEHGRMQAHTMGDYTLQRNRDSDEPSRPLPRGQSAARVEWNKLYKDNPPGTEKYKDPGVQRRIAQLAEILGGGDGDDIVGRGGRTA